MMTAGAVVVIIAGPTSLVGGYDGWLVVIIAGPTSLVGCYDGWYYLPDWWS